MKIVSSLLVVLFMVGCSGAPSNDVAERVITDSMHNAVPMAVIGNMLGGTLVKLKEIDIEKVEKKTFEPNVLGKAFGKKAYTYWAVTAHVQGTGRVKAPFGGAGELRGFNARHIWTLRQEQNGTWSVTANDFTQGQPEQPANPSWWTIAKTGQTISTHAAAEQNSATGIRTTTTGDVPAELKGMVAEEGACPFEGCTYGKWRTKDAVVLYAEKDTTSQKVATVKAGTSVKAITGVVYTMPGKFTVTSAHKSITKPSISYNPGDVLSVNSYIGEGYYNVIFKGYTYSEDLGDLPGSPNCKSNSNYCWGVLDKDKHSTWWVSIRAPNGVEGWTKNTAAFSGNEAH